MRQTTDQAPTNGLSEPPFPLVTRLAKKLSGTPTEIVASGRPLLDWDDIEREIADQRGAPIEGNEP